MIIAELCNYAPDYKGNFIPSIQSMERFAKEDDASNRVIYIFPQAAKEKKWVTDLEANHDVFFISDNRIKGNIELVNWCWKKSVDILHVHFYGLSSAFLVGWLCKTKIIHHFHNTIEQIGFFRKCIYNVLSFATDKFVACSKAVYDSLLKAGFSANKTSYITNCIDFERLSRVQCANPYNNEKNNVLILGTDFYRKGVDFALKAIEPIYKKYNVQLNVISHKMEETRALVTKELGYEADWVTIMRPVENIGDFYRASSLFLSPSLAEGLSYAVPEALFCECMVLKTNIPSLTYELKNENFITFNFHKELIERIVNYFENEKAMKDLVLMMKKDVLDKYDVAKWGKEVFSFYKCLVEG